MFDKTLGTDAEFLLRFLQARKCYDVKIAQWRSVGKALLQLTVYMYAGQWLHQFDLMQILLVYLVEGTVYHCLYHASHCRSSHCIELLGAQVPVTVP